MDKTQVLEKLEPMSRMKGKTVTHTAKGRVVLEPDAIIIQPGQRQQAVTIPRNSEAERSLRAFAGVPAGLDKKLQADTFSRVLNDLLGGAGQYEVISRNDETISIQKPGNQNYAAPEQVVRTIERGIRGAVDFHRVHTDGYKVSLEVLGTKEQPVERGDLVRGGAMIEFSPIGLIRPSVQAFVVRLACTNGMTSNHALSEYLFTGGGGGDGDDMWAWLRDHVRDAYGAVRDVAASYRRLMQEVIDPGDRAMVLQNLIRRAGLNPEEMAAVQARALSEPPENSYDMMNLITWASSHAMENSRRIRKAQRSIATFVDETEHARVCPVCRKNR